VIELLVKQLIPAIIIFIFLTVAFLTIEAKKTYHRRKNRRSPFTDKFLRGPGQSILLKIDDVSSDLIGYLSMLICIPLMIYATFISDRYFRQQPITIPSTIIYSVFGIAISGYLLFRIVKLFSLRRILRLGYEGEVAVAQELNQLMRQGYYVFHDFVADGFNIDHVIIGPTGVYAVETKARAKPNSDE
jgi:hypothetical protein